MERSKDKARRIDPEKRGKLVGYLMVMGVITLLVGLPLTLLFSTSFLMWLTQPGPHVKDMIWLFFIFLGVTLLGIYEVIVALGVSRGKKWAETPGITLASLTGLLPALYFGRDIESMKKHKKIATLIAVVALIVMIIAGIFLF